MDEKASFCGVERGRRAHPVGLLAFFMPKLGIRDDEHRLVLVVGDPENV